MLSLQERQTAEKQLISLYSENLRSIYAGNHPSPSCNCSTIQHVGLCGCCDVVRRGQRLFDIEQANTPRKEVQLNHSI